jgi:choline monooxygenase
MSIFDELRRHASLPFDQAVMLPLRVYRDPEVAQVELKEIFANDWLCVGRTADLANTGDYLTVEVPVDDGKRSVVVLRNDRGEISAFDNVCVHRGAQLLEGCGHEARITCPYHAWTYRLDGSLIGGPYMQRSTEADGRPFDPSAHHLSPVQVEVWEGFVFVNQNAEATPLAPKVAGLTEVVARYDMAGYVTVHHQRDRWNTNWKLLVENFMDAYHVFHVHKASFGANGDNTLDTTMFPGTDAWTHHRVLHDGGPDRDTNDIAAAGNTALEGPWRKTIVLAAVFPGFVLQLQPDWLWYLQITPHGHDHVDIDWRVAVAPEMLATQADPDAYVADVIRLVNMVNAEDQPVVEAMQRSTASPQFAGAPFSYLERNVYDFDRYIATRLGDA